VTNVGLSGERVSDVTFGTNDVTIARLRSEMATFAPQIVFLLEGVNDLNSSLLHPEVTFPAVVKGLRDLAREARQRGALRVFIATFPPQQAGACRGFSAAQIPGVNDQIRAMVAADGHALVDTYAAFGGVAAPYIGVDGLHPNQLGYQKIAQTFQDAIRVQLELPR
jgi:lysophospholipase L1-like esterase